MDVAVPVAALIFDLDVHIAVESGLRADGEGAAGLAARGVGDCVGGEFAGQQHGVISDWVAVQERADELAGVTDLGMVAGKGSHAHRREGWQRQCCVIAHARVLVFVVTWWRCVLISVPGAE